MAVAQLHGLVDVLGAGHALLHHADGLHAQDDAQPGRGEARGVLHHHRLLSKPSDEGHGQVSGFVGGLRAPHHLHQLHDVDGVEEVEPEEAARLRDVSGDLLDGEGRGVGGQERVLRRGVVHLAEDGVLELHGLRGGLHHQVGAGGRVGQVGGGADVLQRRRLLLGRHLPQLHALGQVAPDALEARRHRVVVDVVEGHVAPGGGRDLGDAVAHGPGAQHRHGADGRGASRGVASGLGAGVGGGGHGASTSVAMPMPTPMHMVARP